MDACITSTGTIIQKERSVPEFSQIEVYDKIDLIITEGSGQRCIVEAGSNLQELILIEVNGSTLSIRNDNTCNFMRSYKKKIKVYLTVTKLNNIILRGSGDVTSTNTLRDSLFGVESWGGSGSVRLDIDTKVSFATIHTATADITFTGKCPLLYAYSTGNGEIHTEDLNADQVYINNSGTGNCFVRANNFLYAEIGHTGDIFYRGKPTIEKTVSGTGKLISF